jgi:hypothetical protein
MLIVLKSGSLKHLEPSGPIKACNGIVLPLPFIMTNLMHKFLIYLSISFYLTCFGVSLSPSSEVGVQLRQCFKSPGYDVSARALTPYPTGLDHGL